ncbi:Hemolysin C [Limihaloglobus sulfuriphilus]|uniref:Hemolysin C n=1 Tax=Limihaloglobus sulfuriphilus TaxID=1851148 RepID=A0A1Q2MI38_9BACT|nr:CNNM domain-containing protein [Limihaloglobus sulfuriphilus]AQQ72324.1 Hemolysin C [Limihaloglobus sulfuriphilus]
MTGNIVLGFLIVILLLLSALFSGSETGFYSLSRLRLRLKLHKGSVGDITLAKLLSDSQGLIYSVLIGNNLVNYLLTAALTYFMMQYTRDEESAGRYVTFICGPLIFIFGEVLPKTIFYLNADNLSRKVAPFIWSFYSVCSWSGLIKLLKWFSSLLARILRVRSFSADPGYTLGRMHITDVLQDTRNEGYFSRRLNRIFRMAVQAFDIQISSVMIPLEDCVCVSVSADRQQLIELLKEFPHTRLPVYKTTLANIIGYINIYEVLTDPEEVSVKKHLKKIETVSQKTSALDAIARLKERQAEFALVTAGSGQRHDKNLGIVTLADLAMLITGSD